MHIGKSHHESFFRGGEDGSGTITFHLHDATLEPSDLFTHTSRILIDMDHQALQGLEHACTVIDSGGEDL